MAAKTRSNRDSGSTDDFLFEQNLAASCPACGARMSAHAVVCLECGHNKQSGKARPSPAWAGGSPTVVIELPAHLETVEKPTNQTSPDRNKAWMIRAILLAGVLCSGSFFSKTIGITAGVLGFAAFAVGMISFVIAAFTELTQNFNARRNLLYHALFAVLALPFGLLIMRLGAPSAKSRPTYNFGWACFMIGLLLMISGAFGLTSQLPKRPPRAIPFAPMQQPAERAK